MRFLRNSTAASFLGRAWRGELAAPTLTPALTLTLSLLTIACAEPPLDDSAPEQTSAAALEDGGHEPHISVFTKVFRLYEPRYFDISNVDRPLRVELSWWVNGTPYPSLFRFLGAYPNGVSYQSELGEYPALEVPPEPGQSTFRVNIEHQSQSPEFRAKIITRSPVFPTELGGCGDSARDLLVQWVRGKLDWEHDYRITDVFEKAVNQLYVSTCAGLCYLTIFTVTGTFAALPGALGPILQVEEQHPNPYQATSYFNSLRFYDQSGDLLREVSGRLISVLPNGNLFISTAMGSSTTTALRERVAAISPRGETVWTREVGGYPPGASIVTAAGNLAMPWIFDGRANLTLIDPATGGTPDESFVDRSDLCTAASTDAACLALKPEAQARFDLWWQLNKSYYGEVYDGPYSVCDRRRLYWCGSAQLGGWLKFNDELVLEIDAEHYDLSQQKRMYHKRLAFYGFGDPIAHATISGAYYRRLTPTRLLISSAYTDWATPAERSYGGEDLAAVGARGVKAWTRGLGGAPALTRSNNNTVGGAGYLMPDNRLLWTAFSFLNGSSSFQTTTIDLANGKIVGTTIPVRANLGLCRMR